MFLYKANDEEKYNKYKKIYPSVKNLYKEIGYNAYKAYKEEKNVMVRDVVSQTVTYLMAVLVSILVAFFVFSMFSSIKGDFKNYDIVEYKVNNYVGMSASAVSQVLSENGIDVKQEIVINEVYPAGFVIKQSVEEGKKLLQGESITLSVAAREGSIILEDFS